MQILLAHPDEVVQVMKRYGYTDPEWIGGYLDRDLSINRSSHLISINFLP